MFWWSCNQVGSNFCFCITGVEYIVVFSWCSPFTSKDDFLSSLVLPLPIHWISVPFHMITTTRIGGVKKHASPESCKANLCIFAANAASSGGIPHFDLFYIHDMTPSTVYCWSDCQGRESNAIPLVWRIPNLLSWVLSTSRHRWAWNDAWHYQICHSQSHWAHLSPCWCWIWMLNDVLNMYLQLC